MTLDKNFVLDLNHPVEENVESLLEHMTLDEKVAQVGSVWITSMLDQDRQFVQAKADDLLAHGIGHVTRISAASFSLPQNSAKLANLVQKHLLENTRLGIPAIVHEETSAGIMARGATTFPQCIGLAATFEPDLLEQMGNVIRQQMRAVGGHQGLAPVMDVVRDPRWGRVEETFGEDPFLIANISLAYIKGLQSNDLRSGVVATGKHFASHGVPEGGRNWAPVHVNARELREIYLFPFKVAIEEGKIASMMNAYHEWDGIPIGASKEMMVDILREELGFDGVVVSDYFTLRTLVDYHRVARDCTEAAKIGLEVGIDVELPFSDCYTEPLKQGIEDGDIAIDLIDASVARVLKMKFDLGLFDDPYVDEGDVVEIFNTPEQLSLSRTLAEKSVVLLKNKGLLPLNKSLSKIAVIGKIADSVRCLQGDYHYPAHTMHVFEQMISENSPLPQDSETKPFSWDDHFPPTVTILEAIKTIVSDDTEVHYAKGCEVLSDDTSGFDEAVKTAKDAEVTILVLGDQSGLGLGNTVGESIDSATLQLPGVQQQLLEAIHATGTPVVLICVTGRPYAITWASENIPAILEGWFPAQEGGTAIAKVLFGDVNPGGKLPMTFPRSVGQVPVYYNHKYSAQRSNWHVDYMDMSVQPLYPFGHGLSYTNFEYSDLKLSHSEAKPDDVIEISFKVINTGDRAGDEVVQLYLADPIATVTRPVKVLKGFNRISLQPGEERKICFQLDVRHLAFYDQVMRYIVEPGEIKVMIGSSSDDIRLEDSFEIVGGSMDVQQVFLTPVEVD